MKNKIIFSSLLLVALTAYAEISDVELKAAQKTGKIVYTSCILVPPLTKPQIAYCSKLYSKYVSQLGAVAAPAILGLSQEKSPYFISPYDVCRYDASHFVFNNPAGIPYCPVTSFK